MKRMHYVFPDGDRDGICEDSDCDREHHFHLFTDAELRAHNERIIRATLDIDRRRHGFPDPGPTTERVIDLIIADAKANQ